MTAEHMPHAIILLGSFLRFIQIISGHPLYCETNGEYLRHEPKRVPIPKPFPLVESTTKLQSSKIGITWPVQILDWGRFLFI